MDRRVRETERRWRESGADDDKAAWLAARVRSGDLTQGRLALAALCADPGAVLAASRLGISSRTVPDELRSWAQTVAVESASWRVSAWMLSASLTRACHAWSPSPLMAGSYAGSAVRVEAGSNANACMVIATFAQLLAHAADACEWFMLVKAVESETLVLMEQYATRELIWDGPIHGFMSHLALRTWEIMLTERWSYTGEIVDRCAQAIHKHCNQQHGFLGPLVSVTLSAMRSELCSDLRVMLISRALDTHGSLRHKAPPPLPPSIFIKNADGSVGLADEAVVARFKASLAEGKSA